MCPFLEDDDVRCAARHSLNKLEEAMVCCVDRYEDCPIYRGKLLADGSPRRKVEEPVAAAG